MCGRSQRGWRGRLLGADLQFWDTLSTGWRCGGPGCTLSSCLPVPFRWGLHHCSYSPRHSATLLCTQLETSSRPGTVALGLCNPGGRQDEFAGPPWRRSRVPPECLSEEKGHREERMEVAPGGEAGLSVQGAAGAGGVGTLPGLSELMVPKLSPAPGLHRGPRWRGPGSREHSIPFCSRGSEKSGGPPKQQIWALSPLFSTSPSNLDMDSPSHSHTGM